MGEPRKIDIRGSLYKSMNKAFKVSYSKEFIKNMEQEQNLQNLKKFIDSNYRESDMIDYEYEHKLHDRQTQKIEISQKDLNREYSAESQKVWKFLANRCIFLSKQNIRKDNNGKSIADKFNDYIINKRQMNQLFAQRKKMVSEN